MPSKPDQEHQKLTPEYAAPPAHAQENAHYQDKQETLHHSSDTNPGANPPETNSHKLTTQRPQRQTRKRHLWITTIRTTPRTIITMKQQQTLNYHRAFISADHSNKIAGTHPRKRVRTQRIMIRRISHPLHHTYGNSRHKRDHASNTKDDPRSHLPTSNRQRSGNPSQTPE